jgi:hypothetical protein
MDGPYYPTLLLLPSSMNAQLYKKIELLLEYLPMHHFLSRSSNVLISDKFSKIYDIVISRVKLFDPKNRVTLNDEKNVSVPDIEFNYRSDEGSMTKLGTNYTSKLSTIQMNYCFGLILSLSHSINHEATDSSSTIIKLMKTQEVVAAKIVQLVISLLR